MRSPLLPIFLIVLVDVLGLTIVIPLLPFYAEHLGATPFVVGLVLSTFSLFQLFSGPILGSLSDRYGRKPLLLLSQLGTLIGFLLLARAESLFLLFVSRAIDGATAGNLSIAQAYITDVTKPENRAKSFALIGIAFGLGFLVGPAVSGWLGARDVHYPIYLACALSLTSIFATAVLLPSAKQPAESEDAAGVGRRLSVFAWSQYRDAFENPRLAPVLLQFFFYLFSFSLFNSGFSLFAERRFVNEQGAPWGPREVGYVFAYAGLLGVILQGGLLGRLVRRFGEQALATFAFVALAVGYLFLSSVHTAAMLYAAATVLSVGNAMLRPTLTALVSKRSDPKEQGKALGLTQSLSAVAQVLAPLWSGVLLERRYLAGWALSAGGFALLAMLPALRNRE